MSSSYLPFERPPDSYTLYSLIPRGLRRFFFASDVQAKPLNDELVVNLSATLPENFAYIWRSANFQITADFVTGFTDEVWLRLLNHISGEGVGSTENISSNFPIYVSNLAGSSSRMMRAPVLSQFAGPVWAVHGGAITFRMQASNAAAAAMAAGFLISHCEFYEYDLTQAQRFYVNTPVPTLSR